MINIIYSDGKRWQPHHVAITEAYWSSHISLAFLNPRRVVAGCRERVSGSICQVLGPWWCLSRREAIWGEPTPYLYWTGRYKWEQVAKQNFEGSHHELHPQAKQQSTQLSKQRKQRYHILDLLWLPSGGKRRLMKKTWRWSKWEMTKGWVTVSKISWSRKVHNWHIIQGPPNYNCHLWQHWVEV